MIHPLVTVVIATFNRLAWLKECMESVAAQTFLDWEVIVIDDSSTDGTPTWLPTQASARVRCFRQASNGERSAARNRGLAEARGRYIMFLDDDDRLFPDALESLIAPHRDHPNLAGSCGGRIKFKPGSRVVIPHTQRGLVKILWPEFLWGWAAPSGQSLFSTAAVRAVGGYSPLLSLVEDRELWLRLARRRPFAVVPHFVLEYRDHGQLDKRPPEMLEIRRHVYGEFIEGLPSSTRARARRLRASGLLLDRGTALGKQGRHFRALICFFRSLLSGGRLSFSPVLWGYYHRGVKRSVDCLLRAGISRIRSARSL